MMERKHTIYTLQFNWRRESSANLSGPVRNKGVENSRKVENEGMP
jgi:hypothetical protein